MSHQLRIDRPTKPKRLGRRLTIQHLEERLTLSSSTGGGFVDISLQGYSLNTDNIITPSSTINGSGLVVSDQSYVVIDSTLDSDIAIVNEEDNLGDSSEFVDNLVRNLEPIVVDPPGLPVNGPEGGSIPVGSQLVPENLPPGAEVGTGISTLQESNLPPTIDLQGLSLEISPRRGREVSFHVASVVPPHSFKGSKYLDNQSANAQSGRTEKLETTSNHEAHRTDHTAAETTKVIEERAGKNLTIATTLLVPDSNSPVSLHSPVSAAPAGHSTSTATIPIEKTSSQDKQSEAAAEPRLIQASGESPLTSEKARSQVFADWRTRDLVAMPVLVALVAGPRLVRYLRSTETETYQQPLKKNH